jgi:16S rRNA (uracil1498-N3)-methyltransferase
MHIFYTPDLERDHFLLPEEESRHCSKVLRLQEGDRVQLVDGRGTRYTALLSQVGGKKCQVEILEQEKEFGLQPFHIHIAVAPPKNMDRLEWFMEKATEIGIQEVTLLQCQRSERKQVNLDRLEKIAISAMKQSLKAYRPSIHSMVPFKDFIHTTLADKTFIAHLEEHNRRSLNEVFVPYDTYCVLVGPEGDFTPTEIKEAYARGIRPITLGSSRLRTETAALVACHTLHVLHQVLDRPTS